MAAIVLIGISVVNLYKALNPQTLVMLAAIATTGLAFLALVVTGGLLSLNVSLSGVPLRVHQVAPALALIFSAVTVYLLVSSRLWIK